MPSVTANKMPSTSFCRRKPLHFSSKKRKARRFSSRPATVPVGSGSASSASSTLVSGLARFAGDGEIAASSAARLASGLASGLAAGAGDDPLPAGAGSSAPASAAFLAASAATAIAATLAATSAALAAGSSFSPSALLSPAAATPARALALAASSAFSLSSRSRSRSFSRSAFSVLRLSSSFFWAAARRRLMPGRARMMCRPKRCCSISTNISANTLTSKVCSRVSSSV
mmetsp:Transcript_18267/g.59090  ORF Transcript_18267/g.59090 Transcript_18267/m.59090 type:complete len:229 (+) Transcript_18267:186-872(+)